MPCCNAWCWYLFCCQIHTFQVQIQVQVLKSQLQISNTHGWPLEWLLQVLGGICSGHSGDARYHVYVRMYIVYIFCVYRQGALPGDLALATGYVCYWRVYNEKSSSCGTCGFVATAVLIVTYNDVKKINEANMDVSSIITVRPLIMRRTEYQNLNIFRLVLQLSLQNLLRPGVKSKMKM